jgi:hypothetical protein
VDIAAAMDELEAGGYTATIKGVYWIHGEADAAAGDSASYTDWLSTFISALRTWLYTTKGYTDEEDVQFVITKLSDSQAAHTSLSTALVNSMQAAQVAIKNELEGVVVISTDDLDVQTGSELYYDSDDLILLGNRLAKA